MNIVGCMNPNDLRTHLIPDVIRTDGSCNESTRHTHSTIYQVKEGTKATRSLMGSFRLVKRPIMVVDTYQTGHGTNMQQQKTLTYSR